MNDLITRIATRLDTDEAKAEHALGTVFALLRDAAGPQEADEAMAAMPGAEALATKYEGEKSSVFAKLGGGALAAFTQLAAIGLTVEQIEALGREVNAYAEEKLGHEKTEALISSIPGLAGLI